MLLNRSVRFLPRARIRSIATTPARHQTSPPPPLPECSPATCTCAGTPPDLDIDRKTSLLHTTAPYAEQVLICTGKDDWTSRIEDEDSPSGDFVRGLKGEIGRGGEGFDPFNNVLTTLSSFPASPTPNTTIALLFPSFKRIEGIPNTKDAYAAFATAYLKARTLHPAHMGLTPEQKAALTRDEALAARIPAPEPITKPTVLICGHGGRDQRCGVLGPMLQSRFRDAFKQKEVDVDVGLISHIGGHKYAGNVIIYLPPGEEKALAGWGIWYGRVGPANVEEIVQNTVVDRRVALEFLRGGITHEGKDIAKIMEPPEEAKLTLKPKAR
ncbi:hypothetical protein BU23DRAFT_545272 [Bimuria novae-zelandiae CBS 107.79]|uniref:Altered inheritance of mitochondria protein 32 n=1 Tax=Bimuria novae-zelandiae CBS 107.79 TaxID=1447943 RepID=A0A6A5UKT9_9PLEO|nr:hypothetical protein BU23DRAFT_545272 [Bimuria novae-zelandiae CBS 107.79]